MSRIDYGRKVHVQKRGRKYKGKCPEIEQCMRMCRDSLAYMYTQDESDIVLSAFRRVKDTSEMPLLTYAV